MSTRTTAAVMPSAARDTAPVRKRPPLKPVTPAAYADLQQIRKRWNEVLDLINDMIADFEDDFLGSFIDVDTRDDLYTKLGEIWATLANDGPRVRRYQR